MKYNLVLSAIAAVGKNNEIGINGHLPWNIPEEYAHYKEIVKNNHVLIGRKNFEANGGDIENCYPIVLTQNLNFKNANAKIIHNLNDLSTWSLQNNISKIFVIGGAEIYKLTLPYISEFHLSRVNFEGKSDTFFPTFDHYEWKINKEEKHTGWTYQYLTKKAEVLPS